jgi:hypothetical protein
MDLDILLAHEEGRHVLADLLRQGVPMGALLLRYVALFRPAKRALSMSRTLAVLSELLPDLQRGAITRKGRDWPTTPAQWQAAIELVLAARDKGNLTLPMSGHGYLYEVLLGIVDKVESQAEREREASLRGRAHVGGPLNMDALLAAAGQALDEGAPRPAAAAASAPPVIAVPAPTGPSRYSQKLRAQIAAIKARQTGGAPTDTTEGA